MMSIKKIFGTLSFFIIILIVGFKLSCSNQLEKPPLKPIEYHSKFNSFVEDWNQLVIGASLGKKHYLPEYEPEKMIKKLNEYVNSFRDTLTSGLETEMKLTSKNQPYSFIGFYYHFLKKYHQKSVSSLTVDMGRSDITDIIFNLTKMNFLNIETVQIIISQKDPCAYLESYQDGLYKQRLSKNIKKCSDILKIINKEKFPKSYQLISRNLDLEF
jgi:hypothetical protein